MGKMDDLTVERSAGECPGGDPRPVLPGTNQTGTSQISRKIRQSVCIECEASPNRGTALPRACAGESCAIALAHSAYTSGCLRPTLCELMNPIPAGRAVHRNLAGQYFLICAWRPEQFRAAQGFNLSCVPSSRVPASPFLAH